METFITTLHFIVCFLLIIAILLQAGKGADLGASFGAGSSQAMFGPRGAATILSKATTIMAVIFFATSIYLAHRSRVAVNPDSVIDKATVVETAPALTEPVVPESEAKRDEKK